MATAKTHTKLIPTTKAQDLLSAFRAIENDDLYIVMRGLAFQSYESEKVVLGDLLLSRENALQLARKLLEDICELDTKGGRNG